MKQRSRRNPKREPFASSISDDERLLIVKKALHSSLDDSEASLLFHDYERADRKRQSALAQMAGEGLAESMRFADAEASEASATASAVAIWPVIRYMYDSGVRARRGWKRGGKARHDKFSDESAKHESWAKLRAQILRHWNLPSKPSDRRLAMMIARQHPDHPPWETVRGYFKQQKKKAG
jgi:hypothetical protein